MIIEVYIGILSAIFATYYFFLSERKYIFPPGPRGFPIFGIQLSSGQNQYVYLTKCAKKYGPIMRTKAGLTDFIVLSDDPKLIREAFNDPALTGRPDSLVGRLFADGKNGLLNADGHGWFEQRRFVLKNLRNFGFGRNSMESLILEEVKDFINWIKNNEGHPTSVNNKFTLAVVNSLWTIVAGQRSEQDDLIAHRIVDRANDALVEITKPSTGLFVIFPKLIDSLPRYLLYNWNKTVRAVAPFNKILADALEDHIQNPVDPQNPRDLIDVYHAQIKATNDKNSSFYKEKGYKSLMAIVGDLYLAGSGTTSATLTWAILYLLKHPAVQAKLHVELDEVVGKNRTPSLQDRIRLPYTEATLNEILRMSTFFPSGIPHEALEDTKLRGYDIKKGSLVVANIYSIHHNPDIWGDPDNFRPERWLGKHGVKLRRIENLMAFSTGRRQCIEESLARDTIFLFLTSITQRFNIMVDPNDAEPTLDPSGGFLREAKSFNVIFKDRLC